MSAMDVDVSKSLYSTWLFNFQFEDSGVALNTSERRSPSLIIPLSDARVPFPPQQFAVEFAGVFFFTWVSAVLSQLPDLRRLRLSVMMVVMSLAYHLSMHCDVAATVQGQGPHTNFVFCAAMLVISMKVYDFATTRTPFRREQFSTRDPTVPAEYPSNIIGILIDGVDLCFNLRGIGWDWASKTPFPPRPPTTRNKLILDSLSTFVQTILLSDFSLFALQSFTLSPSTRPTISGYGSIIDPTLPLPARYAKAVLMSFLFFAQSAATLQACYSLGTVVGVGLLGQHPAQWPPILDAPWLPSSVKEFWGRRWQQLFRRPFIVCGAWPWARVFGKRTAVLGAFLVSGVMHEFATWGAGAGIEPSFMTGGFVLVGMGCIFESVWTRITGSKVGGFAGWLWAILYLFTCGVPLTDALARRGLFESPLGLGNFRPALLWMDVAKRWSDLHKDGGRA